MTCGWFIRVCRSARIGSLSTNQRLVIESNDLNLYKYFNAYWDTQIGPAESESMKEQVESTLDGQMNRIYDKRALDLLF